MLSFRIIELNARVFPGQVQYQRIVARKTIINAVLRIIFLGLIMAKSCGMLGSL
jgi:hypothetical protein